MPASPERPESAARAPRAARAHRKSSLARSGIAWIFAAAALLSGLPACGPESEDAKEETKPEKEEGDVMVLISFDEISYVDAAITPQNMLSRVQHQTRSGFLALGKAGITVSARRQLEVDRAALRKDKVMVVDLATGITRSALRLRYHFESLAVAPRSLLDKGEANIAVLHTLDDAKLRDLRAACSEKADAVAPLWSVFDGSIEACAQAVANEQNEIEAARRQLTDPANEIVSIEFERRYLPVRVRVEVRRARAKQPDKARAHAADAGAEASDLAIPDSVKLPGGLYLPEDGVPAYAPPGLAQRENDKQLRDKLTAAEKEEDEERERAQKRLNRSLMSGPEQPRDSDGFGGYSAPSSYAVLYVAAVAAIVLLLVGKRQHDKRR